MESQATAKSAQAPLFIAAGVSHWDAARKLRENIVFTPERTLALRRALEAAGIDGCMVLSTCNRSEIFLCAKEASISSVAPAFSNVFPGVDIENVFTLRRGAEAIEYLFRVASGIESMVFGEYQILGQVRAACAEAREAGGVVGPLDRILRDAVSCARLVRNKLDLGAVAPSVCSVAMDCADKLGALAGKRVFVVGSGRTGTLAAEIAVRCGAKQLFVCNRSPERAQHLVDGFGAKIVPYDERYLVLGQCDTVVSATASPHTVISSERVKLERPVVFVDLALPRDIDPEISSNPFAQIIDLDSIGAFARGDTSERTSLEARADEIVKAAVAETMAILEARL